MKVRIIIGKLVIEVDTDDEENVVIEDLRSRVPAVEKSNGNGHEHALSDREQRIVALVAEGMSNKMIALRLCLTESTVKVHMKSILRKLRLTNRTQAALWHTSHADVVVQ